MKKGYTLIELMVSICIVCILSTLGLVISKGVEKQINYIKAKSVLCEISEGISYIKYYCRFNELSGQIQVKKNTKEMILYCFDSRRKILKKIKLPNGISFLGDLTLDVSNLGNIQSQTIWGRDKNNNKYEITISTNIDTINIYEGEG